MFRGSIAKRVFFRIYRLSASLNHILRRRFSPAGFLLLGSMAAFGLVGIDTNVTMAYQAFALLGGILCISIGCALVSSVRLAGTRQLPRFGTVGVPLPYRISLRNLTRRPQRDLILLENLNDPRPSLMQFLHTPEPGEEKRNWFDRACGYYRWTWLLSQNAGVKSDTVAVPPLLPRAETVLHHQLLPSRRGVINLNSLLVAWPDPFGIFRSIRKIPNPQSIVILPKRYPVSSAKLPGRRQYQPGGVAFASNVGESEEFVGLREYRPGDPLRHMHWRSMAKFGKPIIKEFQDEYFVRHALVLDTFSERGADEVFEEAISVAASFVCTVQEQDSLLDLLFVGSKAFSLTVGRSVGSIEHLLETLATVGPSAEKDFSRLQSLVLRHTPLITGCICVFLAWDETRRALVGQIRSAGVPTLVLVVRKSDPKRTEQLTRANSDNDSGVQYLYTGKIAEGLAAL